MTIGIGILLIAVGAILRFGISTVSTHGIGVHRDEVPPDEIPPTRRYPYEDEYRR